jgi:F0F1-type ATP synthase assembly protein I
MSSEPSDREPKMTRAEKDARDFTRKSALALELPFTMVGAVVVGGFLGYFLDKWLHTNPWLTVILGAFGFFGGVREVIRRLNPNSNGADDR